MINKKIILIAFLSVGLLLIQANFVFSGPDLPGGDPEGPDIPSYDDPEGPDIPSGDDPEGPDIPSGDDPEGPDIPSPLPSPTVDIRANGSNGPITLYYGSYITLSWTSTNAVLCQASGDWSGSKDISGTQSVQLNQVKTYNFAITCWNADGKQAADSVNVVSKTKVPTVITKPAVITY